MKRAAMSGFSRRNAPLAQWRAGVFEFLFDHIQHRVNPCSRATRVIGGAKIAACTTPDLSAAKRAV